MTPANPPATVRPVARPRRLRARARMRELAAETRIHPSHLIVPHFVTADPKQTGPIKTLPGVKRQTPEEIVDQVTADLETGLATHLLFGVPEAKTADGAPALDPDGPVPRALRALRDELGREPNLLTDVCLCAYTEHGHCGVLSASGVVDNDATLPVLAQMARVHAESGADMVCPSDMMDGRVRSIRTALDEAGHHEVAIMSYSAKYASAYYGPFRDAAGSRPGEGNRKGYQMDPRNLREAVREILLDVEEGADAVMVKPALAYLDVIRAAREATSLPLACYNVSGEYVLTRLGAQAGLFDEGDAVREQLTAMKRAGADWIITYHARDAVKRGWLA